jgi:hypothetical protein
MRYFLLAARTPSEDLIMADTKVEEKTCLIPTFERNRYFFGKPMTVRDFDAEQQYMIGKRKLEHRLIHGSGIICGLVPSEATITGSKFTVFLTEGVAIDCCGNLIVVNKSDHYEVQKEGTSTDGPHYLYVRFAECIRQPIMASANVSSCEEVCCYNRIRETFEIFLSDQAPPVAQAAFSGSVKNDRKQPIAGAHVKAFAGGVVQAETLTDINGKFSLGVATAVPFDVTASATGFGPDTKPRETIALGQTEKPSLDFILATQPGVAPADVCMNVTQDYFDGHLKSCRRCDDPKVFLAVANIIAGKPSIDPASTETRRRRSVVYTNPMLHDLLCDHLSDFNNPHRTTAAQVKALQNINGVGNSDSKAEAVPRIDIVSDGTIQIEPAGSSASANKITIKGPASATQTPKPVSGAPLLGTAANSFAREDHVHTLADEVVERKHLSDDTVKELLFSPDASISVTGDISQRQINISTKLPVPGKQTPKPVSLNATTGTSPAYSPEDHVHSLDDKVVGRKNLSDDTFGKLVFSSDSSIKVVTEPGTGIGDRQINITTKPAPSPSTQPPSKVSLNANSGNLTNYSREDHVHDLADRVVTNAKLADEIITGLVAGDGTIIVNGSLTNPRQIKLSANPPQQVKTVGPDNRVGESLRFAREDHVHSLRINESAPDANGKFLLSVRGNLELQAGARNEVIISTKEDRTLAGKPSQVITGQVRFEAVRVGEARISPPITPGIGVNFAIVLGVIKKEELVIGELSAFDRSNPVLEARYQPNTDFFRIDLKDTRTATDQTTIAYMVRWWAIPFTSEIETVTSLPPSG